MDRATFTAFLLGSLAAGAIPAQGASFACANAHTRIETMICGDPALSKLDETMAKDFRTSVGVFDNDSPGSEGVVADLRAAQKTWLATRDACADAACVKAASEARIAVLEFHGRPGRSGWADRLAGIYKHDDVMTLSLQVRDDSSLLVAISGADPKSARWTCDFTGLGKPATGGGLTVTPPGGTAAFTLASTKGGLEASDTPANHSASKAACGLNGTMIWPYARH